MVTPRVTAGLYAGLWYSLTDGEILDVWPSPGRNNVYLLVCEAHNGQVIR